MTQEPSPEQKYRTYLKESKPGGGIIVPVDVLEYLTRGFCSATFVEHKEKLMKDISKSSTFEELYFNVKGKLLTIEFLHSKTYQEYLLKRGLI